MRQIWVSITVLLLTGCSVLSPIKNTKISSYTLTAHNTTSPHAARGQRVVLVSVPTAAPGYQTSEMIYTFDRYELNSFAHNRWVAPPAEMLQSLLVQSLQQSGCFRAVVTPPFSGVADVVLDTTVLTLQQEFSGATSQINLALQATLSNSNTRQVLANRQIQALIPTMANTPYAGVVAANQAMHQVLQQITQWMCKR